MDQSLQTMPTNRHAAPLAILSQDDDTSVPFINSDDPRVVCAHLNAELAKCIQYALRHTITDAPQMMREGGAPSGVVMRFGNVIAYQCPPMSRDTEVARQCQLYVNIFFKLLGEVALVHGEKAIHGYPVGLGLKRMKVRSKDFLLIALNPYIFGDDNVLDQLPDFKPLAQRMTFANLAGCEISLEDRYPAVMKEIHEMQNIDLSGSKLEISWLYFWG